METQEWIELMIEIAGRADKDALTKDDKTYLRNAAVRMGCSYDEALAHSKKVANHQLFKRATKH